MRMYNKNKKFIHDELISLNISFALIIIGGIIIGFSIIFMGINNSSNIHQKFISQTDSTITYKKWTDKEINSDTITEKINKSQNINRYPKVYFYPLTGKTSIGVRDYSQVSIGF